jgi:hypothetical protein
MNYIYANPLQASYDKKAKEGLSLLSKDFKGTAFRLCNFWFDTIPVEFKPIKYLEVGILYGANAISVANSYALHPESEIHCIDPWDKYDEYGKDNPYPDTNIYNTFIKNVETSGSKDKFKIYKDYSYNIISKLNNDTFDMIYIDGNHGQISVLEDAVLCFRKIKKNGYIIFDDINWTEQSTSLHYFLEVYKDYITILYDNLCQLIIQKRDSPR